MPVSIQVRQTSAVSDPLFVLLHLENLYKKDLHKLLGRVALRSETPQNV